MAQITQFFAGLGFGGRLYGDLSDKAATATPASAITMFWPGLGYGGMRYNYVAMADKSAGVASEGSDWLIRMRRRRFRRR